MNFYQSEGSSRTIRIALIGFAGFFVVFFVVIRQALAITILSVVPIAIVVLGFSVQRRKSLVALMPPVTGVQPHFAADGVCGQPYPQAVLYAIKPRNLHLLLIPIGISVLSMTLVMRRVVQDYADNPLPLYASLALLFIAALSALRWFNECRWVRRAVGTYALIGERPVLLLCAPESPQAGHAALACRYHGFAVVDVKHVTEDELKKSGEISQ